jgi:hypothetical protein
MFTAFSAKTREEPMTFKEQAAISAMQALLHHFDFEVFAHDPKRLALWAWEAADHLDDQRTKREKDK